MRVLVIGGAGYIGSHTAKYLSANGLEPIVFDNLSMGHRWAVKWGPLVTGDLANRGAIRAALLDYDIEAVIHFAASAYVGESMQNPGKYFANNVTGTLNLLQEMQAASVKQIVFSSSCATYGVPQRLPIAETHLQLPVNPYGESKLFIERALHWYSEIHDFRFVTLRYFNAAGADPDGEIGEDHQPETHLIPLVIEAARQQRTGIEVYGADYPTPDGTAVRDYVHVTDIAYAHFLALQYLISDRPSITANLGTGRGLSVKEVVEAVERHSHRHVRTQIMPRRQGDPPVLVADSSLAAKTLGWSPKYSSFPHIIETAWEWHVCRPQRTSPTMGAFCGQAVTVPVLVSD